MGIFIAEVLNQNSEDLSLVSEGLCRLWCITLSVLWPSICTFNLFCHSVLVRD